jgi:hypothetical protein
MEAHAFCACCRKTCTFSADAVIIGSKVILPGGWDLVNVEGRLWAVCSNDCKLRVDPEKLRKMYEDRMARFKDGNAASGHDPGEDEDAFIWLPGSGGGVDSGSGN